MKKLFQRKILLATIILSVIALGGAAWWYLQPRLNGHGHGVPAKPAADKRDYKFVSLDKVIVMLHGQAGQPRSHYISVDLVFKSPAEREHLTKEQLPLLRSIAVRALSNYTLETAGMLTIDQLAAVIDHAYTDSYLKEHIEKPFSEVMIGKLIIE